MSPRILSYLLRRGFQDGVTLLLLAAGLHQMVQWLSAAALALGAAQ